MIDLSFIVPYYNGQNTIIACLNSIYSIDLPLDSYEVIVVDDNSPVKASEILIDYVGQHTNLRIVRHSVNKRQGGAKNTGIRLAGGRYIAFADQDDVIVSKNVVEALQIALSQNLDILCCHYNVQYNDGKIIECGICHGEGIILTGKQFCEMYFVTGYNMAPWANLYRREYLLQIDHPYEENVLMEDSDWVAWHWAHAGNVGIWNHSIYTWIMNHKSITHSQHYKNRADWVKMGYRKMRDVNQYLMISSEFAEIMYQDGKNNIFNGFKKMWKVDSYVGFYKYIGRDILSDLSRETWSQPARIFIMHPYFSCVALFLIGPILKFANYLRHCIINGNYN